MGIIRGNYVNARETFQRIDAFTHMQDVGSFLHIKELYDNITSSVESFRYNINLLEVQMNQVTSELLRRLDFHYRNGLVNVKYIVEHWYIRGFDIIAERVLDHITKDMYEIEGQFDNMISGGSDGRYDNRSLQILQLIIDNRLAGLERIAARALVNITEVNDGFTKQRRLLNFQKTPFGRYDKTYSLGDFLLHDSSRQSEEFNNLTVVLQRFILSVEQLRTLAEYISVKGIKDKPMYNQLINEFIKSGKAFNYRRFQYREKVIYEAALHVQARIDSLQKINQTRADKYKQLIQTFSAFSGIFRKYESSKHARTMQAVNALLMDYLGNDEIRKYNISKVVSSSAVTEALTYFRKFFVELRIQTKVLIDILREYGDSYFKIWGSLLGEESTRTFYARLGRDVNKYLTNRTNNNQLAHILSQMIGIQFDEFCQMSDENITVSTNGDFYHLNITEIRKNFSDTAEKMVSSINLDIFLQNKDTYFSSEFDKMRSSLSDYTASLKTDKQFLR